jgi:tRNA threonylcarbamoyladenosine biosynthesis protein TsaE
LTPDPSEPPGIESLALLAGTPAETDRIGTRLAGSLAGGDVVMLSGAMGVGKSHLARSVIRSLLNDPEAVVASPTYTIANVYDSGRLEIWHADLYRLTCGEELAELGLEDAVGQAIVLVEWPERWSDQPDRRLDITLEALEDDRRQIRVRGLGGGWDRVMNALGELE